MEEFKFLTSVKEFYDKELSNFKSRDEEKHPFEFEIENYVRTVKENNQDPSTEILAIRNDQEKIANIPYNISQSIDLNKDYFKSIQSWKGHILEIHKKKGYFVGELEDLTDGGTKEIAHFFLDEIPSDDLELVKKGSTFYWNIGYRMKKGTIKKESSIRFQRIISWNEEDFNRASDRASTLLEDLQFE